MAKSNGKSFFLQHCCNLLEGNDKWKMRNDEASLKNRYCSNSSLEMDDNKDDIDGEEWVYRPTPSSSTGWSD